MPSLLRSNCPDGDSYLADVTKDRNVPLPEEAAEYHLRKEQVGDALRTFGEREARIPKPGFGPTDGRSRTLKEVSWDFGVTRAYSANRGKGAEEAPPPLPPQEAA